MQCMNVYDICYVLLTYVFNVKIFLLGSMDLMFSRAR